MHCVSTHLSHTTLNHPYSRNKTIFRPGNVSVTFGFTWTQLLLSLYKLEYLFFPGA